MEDMLSNDDEVRKNMVFGGSTLRASGVIAHVAPDQIRNRSLMKSRACASLRSSVRALAQRLGAERRPEQPLGVSADNHHVFASDALQAGGEVCRLT